MRSAELARILKAEKFEGDDLEIKGISYNSRAVRKGDVFFCIPGERTDGHYFAREALSKGAIGLVVEKWIEEANTPFQILVENSREALARASAFFYGEPSKDFLLIGVTGTNGKTTTTYLLESIFKSGGKKSGLIGTVEYRIGDKVILPEKTTPESSDLQKIFLQMKEEGVEAVAMEVSSHSIHQGRVSYCFFDKLIFTNLSRDHLDYHKTMEEYFEVKKSLFEHNPEAMRILNADDLFGQRLLKELSGEKISYGVGKGEVRAENIKVSSAGVFFSLLSSWGKINIRLKLKGRFNVYNALAASSAALSAGFSVEDVANGLESVERVPGRLEPVNLGQDFMVLIDYAHTPDGLKSVLETCREVTSGKLIVVFGCGGDRDRKKRPLMGRIAAQLADYTIITSDNPRSEEPEEIIKEIEKGYLSLSEKTPYEKIVERREAIKKAIWLAEKGDTVLIAGKGHERYQIFKDKKIHFDDFEVAKDILKEKIFGGKSFAQT